MITSEYEDRSNCLDDVWRSKWPADTPCNLWKIDCTFSLRVEFIVIFPFFKKETFAVTNSEKMRSKSERIFYFIGLVQTLIIFRGLSNCKIVEITKRKMSSSVL